MKACLISDIHGSQGADPDYMAVWSHILQQRGYEVKPYFLDSLCPAAYRAKPFERETTHRHFVNHGGIAEATLVAQAGHDIYLTPERCSFVLDALKAPARTESGPFPPLPAEAGN